MPTFRRIPKRGFSNARFENRYAVVNVASLEERFAANDHVTPQSLREAGLIRNLHLPVKILGQGDLTKKLLVDAAGFSEAARQKIQKAGGEARVA
jgi:large subunit ribosomal protein L15